ncbi:MAG: ATP-binding cassette domain-containing protein [Chthonomonadales bacterium]
MGGIEIESLDYQVGDRAILREINLSVTEGEMLAIIGQSGCGKTSLLKCIGALARPTGGKLAIDGEDIIPLKESELDRVRLKMGLVFQYAALFDSLSVYENIVFGLRHHRDLNPKQLTEIVENRLSDVGMEGTSNLFPSELSGGMQKRVGLARALALEPGILLYDEPTSGLDPVIAHSIDELIIETRDKKKVTSIIVSHDIRSIFRIADRIAMMDAGTIIASGTPDELKKSDMPKVKSFLRYA